MTGVSIQVSLYQGTNTSVIHMLYLRHIFSGNLVFCLTLQVPGYEVPSQALPNGLSIIEDVVTEAEEKALLSCVSWESLDEDLSESMYHTASSYSQST